MRKTMNLMMMMTTKKYLAKILEAQRNMAYRLTSLPRVQNAQPIHSNINSKPKQTQAEKPQETCQPLLICPHSGCTNKYKTEGGLSRHIAMKHSLA